MIVKGFVDIVKLIKKCSMIGSKQTMNAPATSFLKKFEVGVSGVSTFKMTINRQWS